MLLPGQRSPRLAIFTDGLAAAQNFHAPMFGYAKIFQQIFDSSIADDWQVRHVFEDLLILANSDGVVDMTHDAIARRTNTPLDIVTRAISELEKPDPRSRSTAENGARLKRLDEHRDWGWWIVNQSHYRELSSDEQYREKTRERVRKFRASNSSDKPVTLRNVTVTHVTPSRSSKQIAEANTKALENEEGEGGAVAPTPRFNPDIKIVFDEWNSQKVLPQCLIVSDGRRQKLSRRLQDPFFKENWKAALQKAILSSFCRGESERGWKATFDWFIQPESCLKLMEGKYDNGKPKGGPAEQKQRQENLTAPRL